MKIFQKPVPLIAYKGLIFQYIFYILYSIRHLIKYLIYRQNYFVFEGEWGDLDYLWILRNAKVKGFYYDFYNQDYLSSVFKFFFPFKSS